QGFTVLLMLRILEALQSGADGPLSAGRLHAFAEASKIAYRARDEIVGDVTAASDEARLRLSPDRAGALARSIDPGRASSTPYPGGSSANTVYVAAVDRDRNVVSLISSVYQSF